MNLIKITTLFTKQGFLSVNHVSLKKSISFNNYKAQIWNENFGGMNFLKDHLSRKNPLQQEFASAFIALYPYYPVNNELKSSLKVALYAQEADYHHQINLKLGVISNELHKLYPNNRFSHSIDSAPVLERDLAYRAGLGWIGKNTCLLNKKHGSLFYISEILTDINFLSKNTLQTDHCGTCTRCIDACPTGALSPRKLEVNKCISYRNIEDKDTSILSLDKKTDSWFFGCDVCQTVCPWNEKAHGKENMKNLNQPLTVTSKILDELKSILSRSNKQLEKDYKKFPLNRARGTGLKKNALKIINENKISELKDFLIKVKVSDQLKKIKNQVVLNL